MERQPRTYDVTWFLDLNRKKQLDLDPPYQRKSVWTRKDRQFFLDTVLKNYPCPSVFLHRELNDQGEPTFHVVDGKQRLQTILAFAADEIAIGRDFGNDRYSGKRFSELDLDAKKGFWNYQITVETLPSVDPALVNDVFERINRNSRKLTPQELRHAKFDGWMASRAESEAEKQEWAELGVATTARAKRMADVQFISEIMMMTIRGEILGFDQDAIDNFYGEYDVPAETVPQFDAEEFTSTFEGVKQFLLEMAGANKAVSKYGRTLANFYSLWGFVLLQKPDVAPAQLAGKYTAFIEKVTEALGADPNQPIDDQNVALYARNVRGASTDAAPRIERHKALVSALAD